MRRPALVVVAGALALGATAALHPLAASATGLCLAWLALRSKPGLLALAALAFTVGLWRADRALGAYERQRVAVRDALVEPSRCAGNGRVVRSPELVYGQYRLTLEFQSLDCEGRLLPGPLRVRLYGGPTNLRRGDELEAVAQLAAARRFRNFGASDRLPMAASRQLVLSGGLLSAVRVARGVGLAATVDVARAHARERIVATFPAAASPMARALVLGENDLEPEEAEAFRNSGLAHLLAVSGTHLVFAVVSVIAALRALLVRIPALASGRDVSRVAASFGIPLALVYADYAGGSGSAWRAAWMLAALFLARALARHVRGAEALVLSLLVGAAVDPLVVFDISFMLSAAATLGLLTLGRVLATPAQRVRHRGLRYLCLSLAATTSALLPCLPLLALLAPTQSAAGLLANVVAAPVGELAALPFCLLHACLTPWPALEQGVALVASGALLVVRQVALTSASLRWCAIPIPNPTAWHFAVLVAGIVGFAGLVRCGGRLAAWQRSRGRWALLSGYTAAVALSLVGFELVAVGAGAPLGQLRVTMLDVGQGDATLVDFPDGRSMLIDGGGFVGSPLDTGRAVLLPVLRSRRRERVAVAVLSHAHPDHFLGLLSALPELEIGELWLSKPLRALPGPVAEMARALQRSGTRIVTAARLCLAPRRFGAARVEILAPCPAALGSRSENDNSLVLHVSLGRFSALLPGDAERAEEQAMVGRGAPRLRANFLKVGHHGSRTSSTRRFLAAVRPQFAGISSGVRNRHGHPHPEAIGRLVASGTRILRTDRMGSIEWRTDGLRQAVRSYSEPR